MSVRFISPSDVVTERANGQPGELIDVRTPAEFRSVHATGATLIPYDQFDPVQLNSTRPSVDTPIYLICESGARAGKAAEKARAAGVTNVAVVEGGTSAWVAAGLPVERGRGAISLERQVRIAAGSLVLIGIILGWFVHRGFFGLSAFVGAGLVFAGVTDTCGMGLILARMPWNRVGLTSTRSLTG